MIDHVAVVPAHLHTQPSAVCLCFSSQSNQKSFGPPHRLQSQHLPQRHQSCWDSRSDELWGRREVRYYSRLNFWDRSAPWWPDLIVKNYFLPGWCNKAVESGLRFRAFPLGYLQVRRANIWRGTSSNILVIWRTTLLPDQHVVACSLHRFKV